jgi:hypothetical protein
MYCFLLQKGFAMRKKLLLSIGLTALLLVILPGQISHATPTPPYILVNDSTRECYITILGDECSWCDPPQGWKTLGMNEPSSGAPSCPAGYTKIDRLELNCTRYKTPYCCGAFSSHGDCEDMIVNATQQACAFVEDVNACILPEGWSKRPTDVPEGIWNCNFNQSQWVEDVTCLTASPTSAPSVIGNVSIPGMDTGPAIGLGLVLILLAGGTLAWLAKKRVKH